MHLRIFGVLLLKNFRQGFSAYCRLLSVRWHNGNALEGKWWPSSPCTFYGGILKWVAQPLNANATRKSPDQRETLNRSDDSGDEGAAPNTSQKMNAKPSPKRMPVSERYSGNFLRMDDHKRRSITRLWPTHKVLFDWTARTRPTAAATAAQCEWDILSVGKAEAPLISRVIRNSMGSNFIMIHLRKCKNVCICVCVCPRVPSPTVEIHKNNDRNSCCHFLTVHGRGTQGSESVSPSRRWGHAAATPSVGKKRKKKMGTIANRIREKKKHCWQHFLNKVCEDRAPPQPIVFLYPLKVPYHTLRFYCSSYNNLKLNLPSAQNRIVRRDNKQTKS